MMKIGRKIPKTLLSPFAIAALFAALMLVLAILGGFRSFSAVPFWDMWNGTLLFTMNFQDGEFSQIWTQHNEHRIVLARILFLLDSGIFGDRGVFLICANYVIAACAGFVLFRYITQVSDKIEDSQPTAKVLSLMTFGWVFLWTQQENFVWAFQSQFFLMATVPLIAFYFLAKSNAIDSGVSFGIALSLGVLSAGTMANGIAVLPMMLLCAFFLKLPRNQKALLSLLSFAIPFAYLYGYAAPANHVSLASSLQDEPITVLNYTMLYLGAPFYHLIKYGNVSYTVAFCSGLGVVFGSISLATKILFSKVRCPFQISLLHYIAFVGATAFATAGGRAIFGRDAVVSERYTTPTVLMWAAFAVLIWAAFPKFLQLREERKSIRTWSGFLAIFSVVVLMAQLDALSPKASLLAERNLAALALELGVHDSSSIERVYPVADHVIPIAEEAIIRNRSVFGHFPLHDLRAKLGRSVKLTGSHACTGFVDEIIPVRTDPRFFKVRGWIFDNNSKGTPELVSFVNSESVASGFAISGWPRNDVASVITPAASLSGFFGYLQVQDVAGTQSAIGFSPDCVLEFSMPK